MTFSIPTRVVVSHCGFPEFLAHLKKFYWLIGLILLSVILRVSSDFLPFSYFEHLALAAGFWIMGVVLLCLYLIPKLFFIPKSGEGEIGCS